MARKWLPEHVTQYKDRHGKARYRFRRKGLPAYHFRHAPGTPEFMAEYNAAVNALPPPRVRFAHYTYDALIDDYYRTVPWIESKDSTKKTYRNIIERFRAKNGDKDVRRITTKNIDEKLAKMKDTPGAANSLRKVLARLHRHAIKLDWRADNPVTATDSFKKGKGFHCWDETELAAFDKRWPNGTRERLAKELLLGTALRKTDVLTVGPSNRVGNSLHLHHGKNDSATIVPMGPPLIAALDALDEQTETYLRTMFDQPFSSTGFYNWFKRACVKAGIPHCSPHGLRKAISRRLAESGATVMQGRAVTGHKTDKEFLKYAESAQKAEMAETAMANLHDKFAKPTTKTPTKARD